MQFNDVTDYCNMLCLLSAMCIKRDFYKVTDRLYGDTLKVIANVAQIPTVVTFYKVTDLNLLGTE